jgi:Rieske Fe-S protein
MSLSADLHQEPRRGFLKVLTGLLSGFVGAVATLPGLALLLHPARRETVRGVTRPLRVAALRQLQPGRPVRADVRGELIDAWSRVPDVKLGSCWLVREEGERGAGGVRAFSTVCPHLGCGIDLDQERRQFRCPCHQSVFDMNGQRLSGPSPRPMDELDVVVENEEVKVAYRRFRVGTPYKEEV